MGSLSESIGTFQYPDARRDDTVIDYYHGVCIPDPYRWLEDTNRGEVKQFIAEQTKLTESVLQTCETREKLREHIGILNGLPTYSCPFRKGNKYFHLHNSGFQAHSVLYVQDRLDGNPEILFDPNKLEEGKRITVKIHSVSENAKFLAVGLSFKGTDWIEITVLDIEDRKKLPDTLSWVKYSKIAWTRDNKGFFYCRYPKPVEGFSDCRTDNLKDHQVYYHFVGTDQADDILCWRDIEHPKWMFHCSVTEDGKYIILYINEGCQSANMLFYCSMDSLSHGLEGFKGKDTMLPFQKLIGKFESNYHLVTNDTTKFSFKTNKDAPKSKLVRVDIRNPECWIDIVQESNTDVLMSAYAANKDKLLIFYLRDVKYVLQVRNLETGQLLHSIPIGIGTISSISARLQDNMAFISFNSFLTPGTIYKCNLDAEEPMLQVFNEIGISSFDPNEFQFEQVFVITKDGTRIPMFIASIKNLKRDGKNAALLYGYGGFNISITPTFKSAHIVVAKHLGVICAFANIRGGGEYGQEWHKSGSLVNKQNCFDDFIACAEHLVDKGYTQPRKLCIEGASNGGLLVAACANQRPDLFGCVLAQSGLMDMLRFQNFTIAHTWISEYGCSGNRDEFHRLKRYSPLHNVQRPWEMPGRDKSQYPAVMLMVGDQDDRVPPFHSLKLLATMQFILCKSLERTRQTNPLILRTEQNSGHGSRGSTQKRIDVAVDGYAFMAKMLEVPWLD